ncbi:MAG: FadR family transcriptional regulator [Micromonosporaceae bacterium]|jgi:GntR family transcriptional repressor for pyruvate dehydrogenase complex|nr:FadR family transcriptional regulator [Micromonosporaceae bacterium]
MSAGQSRREQPLSAHQRVVTELERLVFGELEPGSPLPSEAELAEGLSVSRLTVREAVKSLQARGLIQVRHGRRPVIAPLSATGIEDFFATSVRRDPRRLLDLLEVRRALEVHIAGLAARNVNRSTATAMQDALAAMQRSVDDPEAFNAADVRFHEALAAASGNQILTFLIEAMQQPLRTSRLQSRRGHIARGRPLTDVIDEHARIYDRVMAGDAAGAEAAMREHLAQTERSLYAALDLPLGATERTP